MKQAKWIILLVFIAAQSAMSHPPSKIILDFNSQTHILKVAIEHSVQDTVKHFINALTVSLNGNEVVNQKFLTQSDSREQEVLFLIHDAKSGDKIEATASCNVFGKKKESLTLP
jgi:desulfoferrodoxin (superoxide reductase-like protein)